jgi:hypothetical protein
MTRSAGFLLLPILCLTSTGCIRAEAAGQAFTTTGSSEPFAVEGPVARPSLDEQLEEWRSACDHLAGDALQACLAPAG